MAGFSYLFKHSRKLKKKYAGKFLAIIDGKVVATGNNRVDVYRKIEKKIPANKNISVLYLPLKEEILTALMVWCGGLCRYGRHLQHIS